MKRKETDRESPGLIIEGYSLESYGMGWFSILRGVLFCSTPSIRRMSKRAIHGVRSLWWTQAVFDGNKKAINRINIRITRLYKELDMTYICMVR